jgi:hypothetical protein
MGVVIKQNYYNLLPACLPACLLTWKKYKQKRQQQKTEEGDSRDKI